MIEEHDAAISATTRVWSYYTYVAYAIARYFKFDGSRKAYSMWKVEADNKLRIDEAVLGTFLDQAAYLFLRMEAKAQ